MKVYRVAIVAILLTMAFTSLWSSPRSAFAGVTIGQKAPDFAIPDAVTNDNVSLQTLLSTNKGVVLIFVSTQCPYSNGYNARMQALSDKYTQVGVAVIGINSNDTESDQDVTEHKWEHHLTFPILKDFNNVVADQYGASHTPEAYLIDGNGNLVYHGRIDNSVELNQVTTHDLSDAIDAMLAGKPILNPSTKAFGCSIKRVGLD